MTPPDARARPKPGQVAWRRSRLASVVAYRQFFTRPIRPEARQRGTRESDVGIYLPYRYWYPIGRDNELEAALGAIEKKVIR